MNNQNCNNCKHGNPWELINGIVYCKYWHQAFANDDTCGNYKDRLPDQGSEESEVSSK